MPAEKQQDKQPIISVIVRTQNRPHLLQRALKSIAEQSYPNIEVIVVNDGGEAVQTITDDMANYISAGLNLLNHDSIKGRAAAANTGIQAAQGEWIAFLDDDDALEKEGLARLAHCISWDKDMIYGQVSILKMSSDPAQENEQILLIGKQFDLYHLFLSNYIPVCAFICKREDALAINGFDEQFEYLEDWDFLYRLCQNTRVYFTEQHISNYCIWGDNYFTGRDSEGELLFRQRFFDKHFPLLDAKKMKLISLSFLRTQANDIDKNRQPSEEKIKHINTASNQEVQKLHLELHASQILNEKTSQQLTTVQAHNIELSISNQQQDQVKNQIKDQAQQQILNQAQNQNLINENEKLQQQLAETQVLLTTSEQQRFHFEHHSNIYEQRWQRTGIVWKERISPVLQRLSTNIAFNNAPNDINLEDYGLTPPLKVFSAEITGTIELRPILDDMNFPLPIAQGKTYCWRFIWNPAKQGISANVILCKLGTYCRVNQCHLELEIFKRDAPSVCISRARISGKHLKDSCYASFPLDTPLSAGHYLCQLRSPDTDNTDNLLAIWLTTAHQRKSGNLAPNYHYVAADDDALRVRLGSLVKQPLISIIIPVYNPAAYFLQACLESVAKQVYPNWQLCIADDASTEAHVKPIIDAFASRFPEQVDIIYLETNQHISASSNAALALAKGEFVALLDHDDMLTTDALFEVVAYLNQDDDEQIDMFYSDEDKWDDMQDKYDNPYFKPGWAPEMLKSQMYLGHLSVYRKQILTDIGGFRLGIEGSQDWDLALRFTAKTQAIRHIPKILYHWRVHPESTAASPESKTYAATASVKVVQYSLDQAGLGGQAILEKGSSGIPHITVHYPVAKAEKKPLVSIIIPTKDRVDLLEPCLQSIDDKTSYAHWEIIIVDNGSKEKETFKLFKKFTKKWGADRFIICEQPGAFNYSRLVNQGVAIAKGEFILLLNNDTELLSPYNWLEEMIGYAQQPEIACVGCKLLYADKSIQHVGVVVGLGGVAGHGHVQLPNEHPGYYDRINIVSNYAAVTAACFMIKQTLWHECGGFDEQELAVSYNDVDFCLRLLDMGYRHVMLPFVVLHHYESKSRGLDDTFEKQLRSQKEALTIQRRWKKFLDNDPYYNPHLTLDVADFSMNKQSPYYCENDEEVLPK